MRVLFTTQPAFGHSHPLVPLAHALAAGHEVAVACSRSFAPTVEASSLRAIPAGLDWLEEGGGPARAFPALAGIPHGPTRAAWVLANVFGGVTAEPMATDLLALAADWPFDLVARETREFGGCLAAERLGIPHAVVETVAARPTIWPILAAPLAHHRAALGLPPDPELAMIHRYLHLPVRPPALQIAPLPPTHHSFRAPLFDRSAVDTAPDWAAGPLEPPAVYATLGTVMNRAVPGLFAAILQGAGPVAGTLILAVGGDGDPAALGPQPAHVHVERYVPQSLIFPRCDLVVTHGGSGTLLAARAHGPPLVMIPIGADQPDNAAPVAALGMGRVIGPDERTAETIGAAARAVLAEPSYRRNAERLRDEMAALPGPEYVVHLLERLAVEKQPLLTA